MEVTIKNTITYDNDQEVVEQTYPAELTEKSGYTYLKYEDEEKVANVIKFNEDSLVLTRFGQENTKMKFKKGKTDSTIMTPVGVQHIDTETTLFDNTDQTIKISYVLSKNNQKFADYSLEIKY
jgi:Uncharacterized protein conserved in bacteria